MTSHDDAKLISASILTLAAAVVTYGKKASNIPSEEDSSIKEVMNMFTKFLSDRQAKS